MAFPVGFIVTWFIALVETPGRLAAPDMAFWAVPYAMHLMALEALEG